MFVDVARDEWLALHPLRVEALIVREVHREESHRLNTHILVSSATDCKSVLLEKIINTDSGQPMVGGGTIFSVRPVFESIWHASVNI